MCKCPFTITAYTYIHVNMCNCVIGKYILSLRLTFGTTTCRSFLKVRILGRPTWMYASHQCYHTHLAIMSLENVLQHILCIHCITHLEQEVKWVVCNLVNICRWTECWSMFQRQVAVGLQHCTGSLNANCKSYTEKELARLDKCTHTLHLLKYASVNASS